MADAANASRSGPGQGPGPPAATSRVSGQAKTRVIRERSAGKPTGLGDGMREAAQLGPPPPPLPSTTPGVGVGDAEEDAGPGRARATRGLGGLFRSSLGAAR